MPRPPRFLNTIVNSTNNTTATAAEAAADPPEPVAVEPDFVVVLAALLCALICVVGLIAVARCAWLRRGSTGNGGPRSSNQNNKGLKKKVLQSLPKYTYNEKIAAGTGGGGSECAICLAEYADGDEIRVLPQCSHGFHVVCIDTWLGSHSSCPSCRQILVVTRCRKCGECPAAASTAAAGARTEARGDRGMKYNAICPFS
ncbi:hypothetical protein RHGRI_030347 [Rhododendron griersonianum]|uniref:RING-type E3 ubiquitin transferase n=1 Tax=Rhododendron griersonianum TaxID=479676 RepID=A0AAV6INT4_9ERIC|nr:hypothetical protein RHGRI_030347 [Rhododendron griersonianum]